MGTAGESDVLELAVADADDFDALYAELRGVPGIVVHAVPGPVEPGDQGSMLDLLTAACSGGAITVFLQIIKALVESRGPHFVLKVRRGKTRLDITADNADDALSIVKEMLDGS